MKQFVQRGQYPELQLQEQLANIVEVRPLFPIPAFPFFPAIAVYGWAELLVRRLLPLSPICLGSLDRQLAIGWPLAGRRLWFLPRPVPWQLQAEVHGAAWGSVGLHGVPVASSVPSVLQF